MLLYIAYNKSITPRVERVKKAEQKILSDCNEKLTEFVEFILSQYEQEGFSEIGLGKLSDLIELKYKTTVVDI